MKTEMHAICLLGLKVSQKSGTRNLHRLALEEFFSVFHLLHLSLLLINRITAWSEAATQSLGPLGASQYFFLVFFLGVWIICYPRVLPNHYPTWPHIGNTEMNTLFLKKNNGIQCWKSNVFLHVLQSINDYKAWKEKINFIVQFSHVASMLSKYLK